jgi:hypothetical protein
MNVNPAAIGCGAGNARRCASVRFPDLRSLFAPQDEPRSAGTHRQNDAKSVWKSSATTWAWLHDAVRQPLVKGAVTKA